MFAFLCLCYCHKTDNVDLGILLLTQYGKMEVV